ncbi:MAG: choice-of-anchor B family protein [Planctomycetes bacterium]|nr:choice-of-anchor B family protein [Planctomycetota bacterium]
MGHKNQSSISRHCLLIVAAALGLGPWAAAAAAHDLKQQDAQPRYEGPGFIRAAGGAPPTDFDASGVQLQAWLPLGDFDDVLGAKVQTGNDLWGYVSPSGGEYAILGSKQGVAFVDVTKPAAPEIIAGFGGSTTMWRDVKTYEHYAYVVTGGSVPNFDVYDLAQIDQGVVSHLRTVNSGSAHNVTIDTDSGFLYRTGNQAGGLVIYDLGADPVNPPQVGQWSKRSFHDAQAITYRDGPYAGRQIVFGFTGGTRTLEILDVTDKSNIIELSSLRYSDAGYSHQGWLSPDGKYVYLNDEYDERDGWVPTTTTRVINVEDLENPVEVGTFTNGNTAIDHNLFIAYDKIFEANYRSGLRVFDASDPEAPVEIAHFDTYPDDDAARFNGLWAAYPFFPSGTVIGSDYDRGLFIWTVDGHDPTGDVNLDFQFDVRDVDALLGEINQPSGKAIFDLDDDGLIDRQDLAFLVREVLDTELGDANLDGRVDEADLEIMRANWKAEGVGWSQADFTGDGLVNIADLTTVAQFWQFGAADPAASPLDVEAFLAGAEQVPEPSTAGLLLLGSVGLLAAGRRRGSLTAAARRRRPGTSRRRSFFRR